MTNDEKSTSLCQNDTISPTIEHEEFITSPVGNPNISSVNQSDKVKPTKRKRKRRRSDVDVSKKYCNTLSDAAVVVSPVGTCKINQPFHRIVFDESGEACQVVLRRQQGPQVNRKQQKRLGTSNYNWANATPEDLFDQTVRYPMESEETSLPTLDSKNLQVCVHRFPNDYQTVVNYWYTTLEWLDKATYEASMESCECKPDEINPIVDEIVCALKSDLTQLPENCDKFFPEVETKPASTESCSSDGAPNYDPNIDQISVQSSLLVPSCSAETVQN